mmetsp:Transcript_1419/g.3338  ORF Transcript_1419/g.3338 Transcript_1419/m.3338 type:complete len:140 (-) Transcript_1419:117-536(-)
MIPRQLLRRHSPPQVQRISRMTRLAICAPTMAQLQPALISRQLSEVGRAPGKLGSKVWCSDVSGSCPASSVDHGVVAQKLLTARLRCFSALALPLLSCFGIMVMAPNLRNVSVGPILQGTMETPIPHCKSSVAHPPYKS